MFCFFFLELSLNAPEGILAGKKEQLTVALFLEEFLCHIFPSLVAAAGPSKIVY